MRDGQEDTSGDRNRQYLTKGNPEVLQESSLKKPRKRKAKGPSTAGGTISDTPTTTKPARAKKVLPPPPPIIPGVKVLAFGPRPAKWMIVAEAPGKDEVEAREPRPLIGMSGQLLDQMLHSAGIPRKDCFVTNVCKYRPPRNELDSQHPPHHAWLTDSEAKAAKFGAVHERDGLFYNDLVAEGLEELEREIAEVHPQVIIALGNAALWALTSEWGITRWRGSELWYERQGLRIPLIPTLHPAAVLRQWEWKPAVVHDLRMRVAGKMDRAADREMPNYSFIIGDNAQDFERGIARLNAHIESTTGWVDLTNDIETRGGKIACVGFGLSDREAVCLPFRHANGSDFWDPEQAKAYATAVRAIMQHPRVRLINQNYNYDRQYFMRDPLFLFKPRMHYDTMIGQHLLYPGTQKDLGYQSSMYCRYHRYWKDEGKEITGSNEGQWWRYNCLDCVTTFEIANVTRRLLVRAKFATEGLL